MDLEFRDRKLNLFDVNLAECVIVVVSTVDDLMDVAGVF